MSIDENADLKLTVEVYADEFVDLAALLRDAAKEIKRGSTASSVGGCVGAYRFVVEQKSRAVEHSVQRTLREASAKKCALEFGGYACTCGLHGTLSR